jgi:hypothetical protein
MYYAASAEVCGDTTPPIVAVRFDTSPKTFLTAFRAFVVGMA